jgi:hypothetical protein
MHSPTNIFYGQINCHQKTELNTRLQKFQYEVIIIIAIFVATYVTNFSDSQSLIELFTYNLGDNSFLENDILIESYKNNFHKFFSNYFFYYFYELNISWVQNPFFLLNILLKTLTIFGLYLVYRTITKNDIAGIILAAFNLAPSIKVLPYIGDWYVVGPNLHANSIFYALFVFLIYFLLEKNYMKAITLQLLCLLFHPILGLFMALPIVLFFIFMNSKNFFKEFFFQATIKNLFYYFLLIINAMYVIFLFKLDQNSINSSELIKIAFYHAPHHYQISSFAVSKILYFYCTALLGTIFALKLFKNDALINKIIIISCLVMIMPIIHYTFTEIFPSKYIFSLHLLRTSSNLCLIFLLPYAFYGLAQNIFKRYEI